MEGKGTTLGFRKYNYIINKTAVYAQVVCIVVMSILIFADVALRYLYAKPISGTTEMVGFMMTIVGFMGLGICALDKSHLQIDILVNKLSQKTQAVNSVINAVLVIMVGLIMTYAGFSQGLTVLKFGTRATLTHIYVYPFYWVMALGYALLCLAAISNLLEGFFFLKELGKGDEKS